MFDKIKGNWETQNNHHIVRPPVDIYETDKEVVLCVEMPGVGKDTLNVEIQGSNLTINGIRKKDHIEEKYNAIYNERYTAVEYRREFQLNAEVDQHKITANYQNGVLKVTLVKSQEAQPQKIAIT
ncbi:MAG: Hsp20/alpha crystallin family protein [Candidatus Omnitrophica bacterium]|nr:Hsp20/alpha crystallin family protein [Candidatus Omnitrophota bacterium]